MNSKIVKILIALIVLLIVSNVFSNWIDFVSSGGRILESYNYQTKNGGFTYFLVPGKGDSIEAMEGQFHEYRKKSATEDKIVYRTFKKNGFKFWMWYRYMTDEKYKYPYLEAAK